VEVEGDVISVAEHAMVALGQTVTIHLEPVTQPWLDDAIASFDRGQEPMDVGDELVLDSIEILSNDRSEQEATEARSGIDGKHQVPECQSTRRLSGAGVPDLDLGEQHGGQT
jgi:hypothetical protein